MAPQDLIQNWIESEHARHIKRIDRLEKLKPAIECALALVAAFPTAPLEIREYLNGRDQVEVKLEATSLKEEVSIYLEWIEAWAREKGEPGFEFNDTFDYVTSWTTQRDYSADFITLCADVKNPDGGKGCRKVIVGYEEVGPSPIYKIVCED